MENRFSYLVIPTFLPLDLMVTRIQELEFSPTTFWCLHVSEYNLVVTEFGSLAGPKETVFESLIASLERQFEEGRLEAIFADPNRAKTRPKQTAIEWLVESTDLTESSAKETINGFPIPVAKLMNANARNPIQFLALASAIAKNPDAIVYESAGMDPSGIAAIHGYASTHYDGCLVHLATRPIGDDLCPAVATCIVVANADADNAV